MGTKETISSNTVIQDYGRVQSADKREPYFCVKSVQRFNLFLLGLFTYILLFRIVFLVAKYTLPTSAEDAEAQND
jgi:hypothetical protein